MIKFKYTTKFTLVNETKVIDWLNTIAKSEGYKIKKIFYNYVSEIKIKDLNKRHLSHNYSTDILTFDYSQGKGIVSNGKVLLKDGDIMKRNSRNWRNWRNRAHVR